MSLIDLAAEAYNNKLYNFSIKLINKYFKEGNNDSAEAYYYRALSREKLKHYKKALEDYNSLLKIIHHSPKIYSKISIIKIKLFKSCHNIIDDTKFFNNDIIKYLEKSIKLKTENKNIYYYRYIFKNISLPHYEINEKEKEIILNKLKNNFPKMYKYLGYEYKDERYLKKAIEFDDKDYISYYNMAVINYKNIDDSIKYLEKSININPNYYKAYNALALLLLEKEKSIDNYKKAIEYLNKSIELNEYYPNSFFNRQKIKKEFFSLIETDNKFNKEYKDKLKNEIEEDLKKAYDLSNYKIKKSIKYYKVLGLCDDIINNFSFSQLSFPKYDNVLNYIKTAGKTSDNFEKIENYNDALNLDSNYYEVYNLRGFVKYSLGFYEDALIDFNKAIEINKNYADAYYNKGKVYLYLKKYNEAIEYFAKSKELYQKNFDIHDLNRIKPDHYIAWCNYYLGYTDKIFNENIDTNNENEYYEVYYNRGKLRYELGDYKKALEDFYKITDEDDKNYKKALGYIKLCENKLNNIDDIYERCEMIFMLAYEYKNENAFYNAFKFYEEVMNYTKEIDNNSSNAYLFYLIRAAAKIEIFNISFEYDNYFKDAQYDIKLAYEYAYSKDKKEIKEIIEIIENKRQKFNI